MSSRIPITFAGDLSRLHQSVHLVTCYDCILISALILFGVPDSDTKQDTSRSWYVWRLPIGCPVKRIRRRGGIMHHTTPSTIMACVAPASGSCVWMHRGCLCLCSCGNMTLGRNACRLLQGRGRRWCVGSMMHPRRACSTIHHPSHCSCVSKKALVLLHAPSSCVLRCSVEVSACVTVLVAL
jgi:hypothetical protein